MQRFRPNEKQAQRGQRFVQADASSLHKAYGRDSLPCALLHYVARLNSGDVPQRVARHSMSRRTKRIFIPIERKRVASGGRCRTGCGWPWGRNQGGGASRRLVPGDIRPKAIRIRRSDLGGRSSPAKSRAPHFGKHAIREGAAGRPSARQQGGACAARRMPEASPRRPAVGPGQSSCRATWHQTRPSIGRKKTPPKRGFLVMPEAVDQKRYCAEMP